MYLVSGLYLLACLQSWWGTPANPSVGMGRAKESLWDSLLSYQDRPRRMCSSTRILVRAPSIPPAQDLKFEKEIIHLPQRGHLLPRMQQGIRLWGQGMGQMPGSAGDTGQGALGGEEQAGCALPRNTGSAGPV